MGIINNLIGQANPMQMLQQLKSNPAAFLGEELMNNAPDEMTRQGLERMMAEMENR